MADIQSAIKIRSEDDGSDERVHVKLVDGSTPSQRATVSTTGELSTFVHGSDSGTETAITVDSSGHLQIDVLTAPSTVVTATQLDIDDLNFSDDKVDASGSTLGANSGVDIGDVTINNGSAGAAVNIQDGGNTISIDDAGGTLTVDDGGSSLTVDAVDLDIRNLVALTDLVMVNGSDDGGTTARILKTDSAGVLEVSFASNPAGDEVHDYNTSSSVAKNASVNHDYTVTAAKVLSLDQIWASASGAIKIEVIEDPSGTPVTIGVGFSSAANPVVDMAMKKPFSVAATIVVRITITNLDNTSQDVYSTLIGSEN